MFDPRWMNYASMMSYTAHGGVSQMKLGNGLWEHTSFNNRLQPTSIGVGTSSSDSSLLALGQDYGTTNNNGNLLSQIVTGPGLSLTTSYSYDGVNRLWQASEMGSWTQSYGYDRWGNRSVLSGYVPNSDLTPQGTTAFDSNTNHWVGTGYDGAGNQTANAGRSFTYDAEGRLVSGTIPNVGTVTCSYDGEGRRVQRVSNGVTTTYVYNTSNQVIAEYTGQGPTFAGFSYLTADRLGSVRLATTASGTLKGRHDYLPFGEELGAGMGGRTTGMGYGAADGVNRKFTAKERDTETGLDFFGARYISSAQGRFTSPDPLPGWQGEPQSWNMYTYAGNNPLRYVDPDGMDYYEVCGNDGKDCGKYTEEQYAKLRKDKTFIVANGNIYSRNANGTQGDQLGTVSRVATGMDDRGDAVSGGLAARADASNQFIGLFAAGSVVAGTGVGVALQASGVGGLVTLGNINPANVVYQSVNAAGDVLYVGITANFAQREAAHAARFAIQRIPGLQNLTRAEARAVEQVLIEKFGLAKNGGTLLNRINSIASTNSIYANSLRVGAQILKGVGFPGF